MLLWQRIGWPKRYTFLSKLLLLSALGHSTLLFFILFFYKGENFTYSLNLDAQDMTVLFLPFQKTVATQKIVTTAQVAGNAKSGSSRLKVINSSNKSAKNKNTKTKNKNALEKALAKTPETALAQAEEKKGKNKKADVAKKIDEPKSEEKIVAQQEPAQPKEETIKPEVVDLFDEEAVYVGQQDLNALELRQELLQEIEQAWRPPVGLATNKICKVRVLVDWKGKAEDIVFEESSQIVAFDASVRHALLTMQFPKSSYGKELILPFH
jgi:hypothetical protein